MPNNKILVIDDEEVVIAAIKRSLKREGCKIISANNGKDGLEMYAREQPILILLDIRMPNMGGVEFLEHLKLSPSGPCSVIVLTGHGDDAIMEKCFKMGVSSFLKKPYNLYELIGLVRHAIALKQTQREITEYQRHLELLTENLQKTTVSKEYVDNIVNNMVEALIVVNPDSSIKKVNHSTLNLLGYEEDELIKKPIAIIIADEEFKRDGIEDLIKKGFVGGAEKNYLSKQGEKIPVLFSSSVMREKDGNVQGVVCIASDITKRKQSESALKESEERYRTLVEAIPDIVYRIDVNGYFTFISPSIRNLGYEPNELIGKHFSGIINQKDTESLSRNKILPEYNGKNTGDGNAPKLFDERRTGKRLTKNLEARLAPKIRDEGNNEEMEYVGLITAFGEVGDSEQYDSSKSKFIGTFGIIRDITEKTRFEAETIRAGQFAILGELSASVAHEVNTPINSIANCAQLLLDEFNNKNIDNDLIKIIISESDRIANVTRSLLSFARAKESDKSYINVNDLLMDVLTLTGMQLKTCNINVEIDIEPALPDIVAHPQRVQQVFFNIINNARDALNNKSGDSRGGDKTIKIIGEKALINSNPYVLITFYDNGGGISADKINKVMTPFFTTKPRGKGTGLGLSISNRIINDHNGTIKIESSQGEYTKVIISLPVVD